MTTVERVFQSPATYAVLVGLGAFSVTLHLLLGNRVLAAFAAFVAAGAFWLYTDSVRRADER